MPEVIEQIIRYEAQTADAEKQLNKLKGTQSELAKAFSSLKRDKSLDTLRDDALKAARETGDLVDAAKQLGRELRRVGANEDEIERITKEFSQMANAAQEAAKATKRIEIPQQRFETTSQNVALAGDAESNLRAITGAAGALGGDLGAQIEQIGNVGSEILAVTEALPKLAESAAGLRGTVLNAASALGTTGGGLIGGIVVMTAVIAAANFAMNEYNKYVDEQKGAIESAVDVIRDYNRFIADGGTSEAARERIEELERLKEAELATAEATREAQAAFAEAAAVPALAKLQGPYKEFNEELKQSEQNINEIDLELRKYNEALDSGVLSANDAAAAAEEAKEAAEEMRKAEEKLAAERRAAIADTANYVESRAKLEEQLKSFSTEELDRRREALELEKVGLVEKIQYLKEQNDGTEEFAKLIADAEGALERVDDQIKLLSSSKAKDLAQATDERVEAEKELEKQQRELEKEAEKVGSSVKNAAGEFSKASSEFDKAANNLGTTVKGEARNQPGVIGTLSFGGSRKKKSSSGSSTGTRSREVSDQEKAREDYLQRQRDFYNDQQRELLDYQRRIEDIERDAREQKEDAARRRDFAGVAEATRNQDRAIREAKIDTERRLADLTAESQQAQLSIYQNGQNAILSQTQSFTNQMVGQFNNMFNAIQGKSQGSQLEYILG